MVLTLKPDQLKVTKPERFKPNARAVLRLFDSDIRFEGHTKAVCNPSKADVTTGQYKPRMTLTGRTDKVGSYQVTLRVEASLPKLIFGNNFDELTDRDFGRVLDTLSDQMASQGVICPFHELRFAEVSSIHYGKNIVLTDYVTCSGILRTLAKVNVKAWFDVASVDFRNDGHLYKIHSNDFELAFYDKIRDLEKAKRSPKRAYDTDPVFQQSLLNRSDFDCRKQVLRIEARLGSRKRIRDTLSRLGHILKSDCPLSFEMLYSQQLAQQALLHLWQPFQLGLPAITTPAGKSQADLYQQIAMARPKLKDSQILKLVAAYMLVDEIGWSGVKSIWVSNSRTLSRLRKEIDLLDLAPSYAVKGFTAIQKALDDFATTKLM